MSLMAGEVMSHGEFIQLVERIFPMRTVHYEDGRPTPQAEATFAELGVEPSFTGELMTCEICGATAKSDPRVETGWRAIDADGERAYFCPAEFPPDGASKKDYTYQRAMCFLLARFQPGARERLERDGLARPINWRET